MKQVTIQFLRQIRAVLPSDRRGRFLLGASFTLVSVFYAVRLLNESVFFGIGLGGGFWVLLGLPFFCLFLLLVIIHGIVTFRYIFEKQPSSLACLCLVLGVPLALFCPTPPTLTEIRFWANYNRYAMLVTLARNNQLPQTEACGQVYAAPSGYTALSTDCIFVSTEPTLNIEFTPDGFYRPIVYFDNPELLKAVYGACSGDGWVFKQLATHWFICNRDPN